MKKIIMLALLLFVLVVPVSHVTAVEWKWAFVSSHNQKNLNGNEYYFMQAATGIGAPAEVWLQKTGYPAGKLSDGGVWLDGSYQYFGNFYNFVPGDIYAGDYRFYVDTDDVWVNVPTGVIQKLDFVTATISGGMHPTVEWDAVDGADQYRFRLVNPLNNQYLFDEIITGNGGPYSYTYTGDLFSQYNTLSIVMEARDYLESPSSQMINRSRIFYAHTVPEPTTMLLLGLGLVGLAGVRRKLS